MKGKFFFETKKSAKNISSKRTMFATLTSAILSCFLVRWKVVFIKIGMVRRESVTMVIFIVE